MARKTETKTATTKGAADEKTFTIAGFSTFEGVKGFRYANGKINIRTNMLKHFDHEDINLVELPKPMTKLHATAWMLQNMKGAKGAVIPTRAADKTAKNELLLQAEELVKRRKAAASKRSEKIAA